MILAFEPDKTFDIPEGTFTATLDEVRELRKPTSEGAAVYIRFLWRLDALCSESRIAMAGKNYPTTLHENSELRLMLETWLGKEWVAEQQRAGRIDFKSIEGCKATLDIKLIKNSSHRKPFRNIELVLPPGAVAQPTIASH